MKTIITATALACTTLFSLNAQQDAKASKILDEVSKKTTSYSTITLSFKMSAKGQDVNQTMTGTAKIKGDSYFLSVDDQEVYSDGETMWTYLKEDNECYIEESDDSDDFITPTKLLTIWEDGFKSKFIKEEGGIQTINLYPSNPSDSKFHTVLLKIDSSKKQIKSAVIKGKNGVTLTYILTSLIPNKDIPDSTFRFDKTKHPGVTIIED